MSQRDSEPHDSGIASGSGQPGGGVDPFWGGMAREIGRAGVTIYGGLVV